MTESADADPRLDTAVGKAISTIQRDRLENETPASRAMLARLRLAVDEEPGDSPGVWERVMEAIPESYRGRTDAPSDGEWAVHLALTFYAVHQQGNAQPMHVRDMSFGTASGRLVRNRTASTKARLDAALTATTFIAQRYHLRGLIGLMSTDAIPFDYGRFAQDIFLIQKPNHRPGVIRRWGRDFYSAYSRTASVNGGGETEMTTG